MITKFATHLNLDINWKPAFSGDQADLQRVLANQLKKDLKSLSDSKATTDPEAYAARVQHFNFGVDYLRQNAFAPVREKFSSLLDTSLPLTQPDPPAPQVAPPSADLPTEPPTALPLADAPPSFPAAQPEPSASNAESTPPQSEISNLKSQISPSHPDEDLPQIIDDEDDYKSQCAIATHFGKPTPILNTPSPSGFGLSLCLEQDDDDQNEAARAFSCHSFGRDCAEISSEEADRLQKKYYGPFFDSEPPQPADDQSLSPPRHDDSDPATTPRHPATNSTLAVATRDAVAPTQLDSPTPPRADDSPLDHISPANQETIISLLARGKSFRKVAKLISSPPPDGLGIPTTKDSVQRFERRYMTREAIIQQRIHHEAARQLTDALDQRDAFIPATSRLIQKQLFETALGAQLPLDQLTHLARTLARLHSLQINDRKLALAEQRSECDPPK